MHTTPTENKNEVTEQKQQNPAIEALYRRYQDALLAPLDPDIETAIARSEPHRNSIAHTASRILNETAIQLMELAAFRKADVADDEREALDEIVDVLFHADAAFAAKARQLELGPVEVTS